MMRVRTTLSGWNGGPGLSTFYFTAAVENQAMAAECVTRVQAAWANLRGGLSDDVTIQVQPVVDRLDSITGALTDSFIVVPTPLPLFGNGGTSLTSPAAAVLITWVTPTFIAGRRLRGRTFLSPMAAEEIDNGGLLSVGAKGAVTGGVANLVPADSSEPRLVVWHRPRVAQSASPAHPNGVTASIGLAVPVTAGIVQSKIAVLRSRRD